MKLHYRQNGIFLPDIGLWLDAREPVAANWISHAHSDHARAVHGQVFATPETLALYQMRVNVDDTSRNGLTPLAYGDTVAFGPARLTAYPAAHIVGAAQLLVEYAGERLVYTGDIKLRPPLCGAVTATVPCDHLILESTFGLPMFHFLDCDQARKRIVQFAIDCLEDQAIPAFFGYALGRGQEVVYALRQAGIPTLVHGAIARFLPTYQQAGYDSTGWEPYEQPHGVKGKALVVVPGMRNILEASGRDVRIAYVSGWAALSNARQRSGAEHLIPYSDHGDFHELLAIVDRSGARRVDVVHGYTAAFARILRQRGLDARAVVDLQTEAQD